MKETVVVGILLGWTAMAFKDSYDEFQDIAHQPKAVVSMQQPWHPAIFTTTTGTGVEFILNGYPLNLIERNQSHRGSIYRTGVSNP